ncbi:hypothetical protein [Parasedimentitalea denitrificans]
MAKTEIDPKSLMFDAYHIDGITPSECRSIFLDWALSLPAGQDSTSAIQAILDQYGSDAPDHPMSEVLSQGLKTMAKPTRRGGWRGRKRD